MTYVISHTGNDLEKYTTLNPQSSEDWVTSSPFACEA